MSKVWLIAIVVVVAGAFLNNHFRLVAFHQDARSKEATFRLMTYNTNGVSGDYKDEAVVREFMQAIDSLHPQVLALQEMLTTYSSSLCDTLTKRFPYSSLRAYSQSKSYSHYVACLFSEYPIKRINRFVYDRQEIDSIYSQYAVPDSLRRFFNSEIYDAVLDIDGQEALIVCCYLKTNDYTRLRKDHKGSWIDGLGDYYNGYKLGSATRSLDAKMIRDSIASYNLPTIVCGDMNDFQFSSPVKTIMGDDLKNVWWERGMGYGMTYDKYHLKLRIDHVLFSKEFEPVSVDVPHLRFSDHYPIVADMKLR